MGSIQPLRDDYAGHNDTATMKRMRHSADWVEHCGYVERVANCQEIVETCGEELLPSLCSKDALRAKPTDRDPRYGSMQSAPGLRVPSNGLHHVWYRSRADYKNYMRAQCKMDAKPVQFHDWMAPAGATILLEADISNGGKQLTASDLKPKSVELPSKGLSISDTAAGVIGAGAVQMWVSVRVEKSDDATGCACKGPNLAQDKDNLQGLSYSFKAFQELWGVTIKPKVSIHGVEHMPAAWHGAPQ